MWLFHSAPKGLLLIKENLRYRFLFAFYWLRMYMAVSDYQFIDHV